MRPLHKAGEYIGVHGLAGPVVERFNEAPAQGRGIPTAAATAGANSP